MKEPWIPGSKTFEMVTSLLPKTPLRDLDGERTPSPDNTLFGNGQDSVRPQFCSIPNLVFGNQTKETVFFVCDSSGEKDSVS